MFQVPSFEINCTERDFKRASEEWEGCGKQSGLRKEPEVQQKGVSRKRKLVRVSNATEKTSKRRTLACRGALFTLGGIW